MREDLGVALAKVKEEQQKLQGFEATAKQREEQIISDLEAKVKRTLQAKDVESPSKIVGTKQDETIAELRKRCAALDNKASH